MRAVYVGGHERLSDRRTRRPHDSVRIGKQPVDEVNVGRLSDDTALRTRQEAEQCTVAVSGNLGAGCRPPAQRITFRRFDFDDLGTAVGQQLRAVRPGDAGGQVDDDVAAQRWHYFFFLRFDLLSLKSGGNLSSLSLTASARPLSIASIMSRSS